MMNPATFGVIGAAVLVAGSLASAEVACESCPMSGLADLTGGEPPAKVRVRASVATPDGAGQELAIGQEKRLRLKHGGARLDLKLVPDLEAIATLGNELVAIAEVHGVGEEFLERVEEAVEGIDDLGLASIRGVVAGADGSKEEFRLGNAANMKRRKLDQMVASEGAAIELGIEPAPGLMESLDETIEGLMELGLSPEDLVDLAASEAREFLKEGAADQQTEEVPDKPAGNPDLLGLVQRGANDPAVRKAVEKGLNDPAVMRAVEQGLSDPELLGFAQRAMEDGTAQQLLGQFLGAAAPSAKPKPTDGGADEPKPGAGIEAEIEELKSELAEQRALLNKILKRLEE